MTSQPPSSGPASSLHRLIAWPVAHPWAAIVVAGALAALAALSASRIRPNASIEAMFARGDPSAAALSHVLNDFPAADQLIVLASLPEGAPPDPDRLLAFAGRFTAVLKEHPQVESLTDGVLWRADADTRAFVEKVIGPAAMYYLDDRAYAAARRRLTRDAMRQQLAQDKALLSAPGPAAQAFSKVMRQDPLGLHEFIMGRLAGQRPFRTYQNGDAFLSPDGRSLLIRVIGTRPPNDLDYCNALSSGIARVARDADPRGLALEYAGSYAIAALSARSIRHDMIESTIGSVLLLQLLFLVAYRSPFKMFALAFGPVALGILLGFGAYGLIARGLTPITAVLGAILAGMGIDYSIQYLSYYESRRTAGDSARASAAAAAVEMGPAVLAAWATSVVGFLAIGWSHVKALRDFALLGTLGLTGAFVCAVAVLPALLLVTDRRVDPVARERVRVGAAGLVAALGRARLGLFLLSGILLMAAIAIVVRAGRDVLPLETDLTVMHPRPNAAIDAQAHLAEKFGVSPGSLAVFLHAQSPEQLVSLAYEVNRRLTSPQAKAAGITGTYGLAALLPDPAVIARRRAAASDTAAHRVVADFRSALNDNGFAPDAFADYTRFLHLILTQRTVPEIAQLLAYRRIAQTVLPASAFGGESPREALTLVFVKQSLDRDRAARDAAILGVRQALAGINGATLTGLDVVAHDTEQTIRTELPRLILAAVLIVAAYLAVHFRNPTDAILSLLPAFFGMLVAAAFLRLIGQKLNMVNLVAVPLLIGIDVDYGIFLVNLARSRRIRQESPNELVRRLDPVCHAVIICATATILGYVSLIWTSVPAEQSLGIAASAGIAACLAGVLLLLIPVLFNLTRGCPVPLAPSPASSAPPPGGRRDRGRDASPSPPGRGLG